MGWQVKICHFLYIGLEVLNKANNFIFLPKNLVD